MLLMDVPSFGERQGNQFKFFVCFGAENICLLLSLSKICADHVKFRFSPFHRDRLIVI
jgi:hypothetical protein